MLKYTNSFTLSIDSNKKNLLLQMGQVTPKFDDEQNLTNELQKEVLDSYIMDNETAQNLATTILEMFQDSSIDNN